MGGSREEEGWSSKLGFGKGYGFEEMDMCFGEWVWVKFTIWCHMALRVIFLNN